MQTQKISKTITSALAYLRDAADAYTKGDEDKVMQLTWRASSDLEYGLFLFALKNQEENRSTSWKLPATKQTKIELLLNTTQDNLEEAANSLESENLEEAYKRMWTVKGQLLRVHDLFEKKRKTQEHSSQR